MAERPPDRPQGALYALVRPSIDATELGSTSFFFWPHSAESVSSLTLRVPTCERIMCQESTTQHPASREDGVYPLEAQVHAKALLSPSPSPASSASLPRSCALSMNSGCTTGGCPVCLFDTCLRRVSTRLYSFSSCDLKIGRSFCMVTSADSCGNQGGKRTK